VTSELAMATRDAGLKEQLCPACGAGGHLSDASFCRRCGAAL
jgi:ribosomal protein L40E